MTNCGGTGGSIFGPANLLQVTEVSMNETDKVIKHTHPDLWPGYGVDREGRVYSLTSNWRGYGQRELKQLPHKDGYLCVRILRDGKRVRLLVHRMVAAAYLPPRPSAAHELRHLDGDKSNNAAANLAWGTAKENADDREAHGRTSRGVRHSLAIRLGLARKAVLA